jgi:Ca-activated chloride channel family protein
MREPARFAVLFLLALMCAEPALAQRKPAEKPKLPRPRQLDRGVVYDRDPKTGELRTRSAAEPGASGTPAAGTIRARVSLVEVGCVALDRDGTNLRGLRREDFRVFEDGAEQPIAHFDASTEPASIVLVIDTSPSIFRELAQMKVAARALAASLSPADEVAVVAFAKGTHLLLPFSRARALLEGAIDSPAMAMVANSRESNIYEAAYLTAHELFRRRPGRKAILLLTDGQDSGLRLSWDPASALPGAARNRLAFEDVARELAADGVALYAISTEPRPRAMTDAWLDAHRSATLISAATHELKIPHYTAYLAELVRRVGGRLYFLRETGGLSEVYRRIAETLGAQYTLGYYPGASIGRPGWRALRVELPGHPGARVVHRFAYYVPASP